MSSQNIRDMIFVNKPLDMGRIKQVGFGIDNTLVLYKLEFYQLAHSLILKRLVADKHYPAEILDLAYVRDAYDAVGAVDKYCGCLLQVDEFGNIHCCKQGNIALTKPQLTQIYPERSVQLNRKDDRFFIPQTTFDTILIQVYAQIIAMFMKKYQCISDPLVRSADAVEPILDFRTRVQGRIDFMNVWTDASQIYAELFSDRKVLLAEIAKEPSRYWAKPEGLEAILRKYSADKSLFVLTSLDFDYVKAVMTFLLGPDFNQWFDYIIIAKQQEAFYQSNAPFRLYYEQDRVVGLGAVGKTLLKHRIYFNGNITDFEEKTSIKTKNTLYITHELLNSNEVYKSGKWHFCQICTHLGKELEVLQSNRDLLRKIQEYKFKQRELLSGLQSDAMYPPKVLVDQQNSLNKIAHELQSKFGDFGAHYFTSWSLTHKGKKLRQSCDVYCESISPFADFVPYYVFSVKQQNRFLPHQMVQMQAQKIGQEFDEQSGSTTFASISRNESECRMLGDGVPL